MTERMLGILRVLAAEARRDPPLSGAMTCNAIGSALGFRHGGRPSEYGVRYARDGRVMGPANRVNFAVTRLVDLGLVRFAHRPDGMSGTAYEITEAGLRAAEDGAA